MRWMHHDAYMRTTLTLDEDVAYKLKGLAKVEGRPFKVVVNEALRRGLGSQENQRQEQPPFHIDPHQGGFRPGVDLAKFNQMADELTVQDFINDHS